MSPFVKLSLPLLLIVVLAGCGGVEQSEFSQQAGADTDKSAAAADSFITDLLQAETTDVTEAALTGFESNTYELRWRYSSAALNEHWIGKTIGIGNNGEDIITAFDGQGGSTRMLSAHDINPPKALWKDVAPYSMSNSQVASASRKNMHAVMAYVQDSATVPAFPELKIYSGGRANPITNYRFPNSVINAVGGVQISKAGETVVGWFFNFATMTTDAAVFMAPNYSAPKHYLKMSTSGTPWSVHLSLNGNMLIVISTIKTLIYDLNQPTTPIHEEYHGFTIGSGSAISADGTYFARCLIANKMQVYKRLNGIYTSWFIYDINVPGAGCGSVAFSANDGSRIISGWGYATPAGGVSPQTTRILIHENSVAHPLLMDDMNVGTPHSVNPTSFLNVVTGVAISADGTRAAAGYTGDSIGSVPEVEAFAYQSATGRYASVFQYAGLPGSVNSIDMSDDGHRIAVAAKAIHQAMGGNGGDIALFELSGKALKVKIPGGPRVGNMITLEYMGASGTQVALVRSGGLAAIPQQVNGFLGTLFLEQSGIALIESGAVSSNGIFQYTAPIPSNTPVGTIGYMQGARIDEPRELSDNVVAVTVVP